MYLGLVLTPWILLYALSTMAMNHRDWFSNGFRDPAVWTRVSEQTMPMQFSADATPGFMGDQILSAVHLEGNSRATLSKDKKTLTIVRNDPVTPRRITYKLADGHMTIEKSGFSTEAFLERMHRRRGYGGQFVADNGWAVSVDVVVAGMTFWVLSGLWMWWELKKTRFTGALVALSGVALFIVLVMAS